LHCYRFLSIWRLLLGCCLAVGAAAQSITPDALQQHYSAAQTFQIAGDMERAEREYHDVVALALQRMGSLLEAEKNDAEAVRVLEQAVKAQPAYAGVRIDLAAIYYRIGELQKARAELAQVLKQDAKDAQALTLLGNVEFTQGNFREAAEHLKAALAVQPEFETAYTLGMAYLRLQKVAETRVLFDELQNSMGSTPQLHVVFGRAYRATGYLNEAISEFKKAIELNPRYSRAHYYLGYTYLLQGGRERFPLARPLFEQELEVNPHDYFSVFYLGVIDLSNGDFPSAEKYLKSAARLQPDSPDPLRYLGETYFKSGRIPKAIPVLRKCIELTKDPSRNDYQVSRAHNMLGQALMKTGKTAEAEAELKQSEELHAQAFQDEQAKKNAADQGQHSVLPEIESGETRAADSRSPLDPGARREIEKLRAALVEILGQSYHNLGVIQARREEFAAAAEYFRDAAQWKPDMQGLDRNWGLACFRARQYQEAVVLLERQLGRDPNDAKVRVAAGTSYFMMDNYPKAAELFRPALAEPPDDPGVLYAMGASLAHTGDAASAQRIFLRMIEKNPNSAEIHLALGQAYADQDQYKSAVTEFTRALELDPKVQGAHFGWGLVLLHGGNFEGAAKQFAEELASHPNDVVSKYHLAYSYLMQQQSEPGVALLNEVIQEKPDYAVAYYELGKALLERGDVKPAIERLETAARLDPEGEYSYYQLSIAYRREGRTEEADRAFRDYQKYKQKRQGLPRP
jgi:tetratricopeptide (TPR) repeat protein